MLSLSPLHPFSELSLPHTKHPLLLGPLQSCYIKTKQSNYKRTRVYIWEIALKCTELLPRQCGLYLPRGSIAVWPSLVSHDKRKCAFSCVGGIQIGVMTPCTRWVCHHAQWETECQVVSFPKRPIFHTCICKEASHDIACSPVI